MAALATTSASSGDKDPIIQTVPRRTEVSRTTTRSIIRSSGPSTVVAVLTAYGDVVPSSGYNSKSGLDPYSTTPTIVTGF